MTHATRSGLAVLVLILVPAIGIAQEVPYGVPVCPDHGFLSYCSSESTCDRVWREHRCSAHGECGGSSSSSSTSGSGFSLTGSPTQVVVRSAVGGGFAGALFGSFAINADSQPLAGAGAAIGMGSFVALGLMQNRGWSRTNSTVAGAIGGAVIGVGTGLIADGKIKTGTPEDLATESEVGTHAAIGAVTGAAVGFTLNSLFGSKSLTHPDVLRVDRRIRVVSSARRIGLSIAW